MYATMNGDAEEEQVEDLLEDIKEAAKGTAPLDLGKIDITKMEERNMSEEQRQLQNNKPVAYYDMHDGQQRITTYAFSLPASVMFCSGTTRRGLLFCSVNASITSKRLMKLPNQLLLIFLETRIRYFALWFAIAMLSS